MLNLPLPALRTIAALMTCIAAAAASAERFIERFNGDPNAPRAFASSRWDIAIFTRDESTWYQPIPTVKADHGSRCEPPPLQHRPRRLEDLTFRCKSHLMTAMNDLGFGRVTLTPNHMVDFSDGEAVIEFDISTFRRGGYDWLEFAITPFDDNLVHPTHAFWEVAGPPRNGLLIDMTPGGINSFNLTAFNNGVAKHYSTCFDCEGVNSWVEYDTDVLPLVPSQKRRDTFRISISKRRISFAVIGYDDGSDTDNDFYWLDDVELEPLAWSRGVVQLSHSSFNPKNNCDNVPSPRNPPDNEPFVHECDGDTWHWDNVRIEPSTPFTIIPTRKLRRQDKFKQRYVDPTRTQPARVRFVRSAPRDAFLRFSAIGGDIEVSFDSGRSWQRARAQRQLEVVPHRFNNYFHPMPMGTDSAMFRGNGWWGGQWHVRDMSIWSQAPAN